MEDRTLFYDSQNKPIHIPIYKNILINKVKDKKYREIISCNIIENIIDHSHITILIDNDMGMLPIIDHLENQLPDMFYVNLFTPFINHFQPISLNESFDFLSNYKKPLIYNILYYSIFGNHDNIHKNDFFEILENIVKVYNLYDIWGILDKLCCNRAVSELINNNRDRIDILKKAMPNKHTLYDILEDIFSKKNIHPFLIFYIKEDLEAEIFMKTLLENLKVLLKRKWISKDMLINLVINLKQSAIINNILKEDIICNRSIFFNIMNPDIIVEKNNENFVFIDDRTENDESKAQILIDDKKIPLIIEEPLYYTNNQYTGEKIEEYFRKKKKIKRSSSFVIYKSETEGKKKDKNSSLDYSNDDIGETLPVYYFDTEGKKTLSDMIPYIGGIVNCEYNQNSANIRLSKRLKLLFKYFITSQKSVKIDYIDTFKIDDLTQTSIPKTSLKPVNLNLNDNDLLRNIKNGIKTFVIENEAINLFYNKHLNSFSDFQQSYGDFMNQLKKKALDRYDAEIWNLKQLYIEKWSELKESILEKYPQISIKELIENHYIRHFLFSRELDYPENISLFSSISNSIENNKLSYALKSFEEDLLEKLLTIKDKMDRIIGDTVSYPIKPKTEHILIEEISIIYLPFEY